jgi:uncharacterized 2Fe-2S/4Fe-4S cluster protein (DUF4445 family)
MNWWKAEGGRIFVQEQRNEIIFLESGRQVSVADGTSLLQASRLVQLPVEAPCDGRGICGKCRIKATGVLNSPSQAEIQQLGNAVEAGVRLACQAKAYGSVQVEPLLNRRETFLTVERGQVVKRSFNPATQRVSLDLLENMDDKTTIYDGLIEKKMHHIQSEHLPSILQGLATAYNTGLYYVEAIVRHDVMLDLRFVPGQRCLGIALDIGTTSLVAELIDLTTGESLGTHSCLNPQTVFGGDVLTRISYTVQHTDGTCKLQEKIVGGINGMIGALVESCGATYAEVYELVVAGNTTMLHLLLGIQPRSLAVAPYRPVFTHQIEVSPAVLGLRLADHGVVTILPSAAAFVGADIVAGLLAIDFHCSPVAALFIDIGTNGEIVVCKDGMLVGTSAAAGPALEGMNITCGCRAERGAIAGVSIDEDGTVGLQVIGDLAPIGICGSGLVDLAAELVRVGVIEENGRFAPKHKLIEPLAARLTEVNGQRAFLVSETGSVFLTQKDVRQVQLAKGAIAAAIALLLKEVGLPHTDIDQVLVAGAFGYHLKPASLVGIGLLPSTYENKIHFVGNTAKEGAKAVLCNQEAAVEMAEISRRIQINELSLQPEFQDYFVQSLSFPPVSPA